MFAAMKDQRFLTVRINADGGPEACADQTRVPWWSFTKTALAAAALKLVARGCFSLDDRTGGRPYTLRQLVQHRAGVPNYGGLASYHAAVERGDRPWEAAEMLARVASDRSSRTRTWLVLFERRLLPCASDDRGGDRSGPRQCLAAPGFRCPWARLVRLVTTAAELADTAWGNRRPYHPAWVYHGLRRVPQGCVRFLHHLMSGDGYHPICDRNDSASSDRGIFARPSVEVNRLRAWFDDRRNDVCRDCNRSFRRRPR